MEFVRIEVNKIYKSGLTVQESYVVNKEKVEKIWNITFGKGVNTRNFLRANSYGYLFLMGKVNDVWIQWNEFDL